MWVRGLKLNVGYLSNGGKTVAPYVGAWIETKVCPILHPTIVVAPYVGAWIETCIVADLKAENMESHPMWVRGLKHPWDDSAGSEAESHPMWVRGLKHLLTLIYQRL